ncbi:hypothetical protein GPALN_002139 [Globodera pallida]|nr:hypothetical protein GPALN_002139 [Globodera pallida]
MRIHSPSHLPPPIHAHPQFLPPSHMLPSHYPQPPFLQPFHMQMPYRPQPPVFSFSERNNSHQRIVVRAGVEILAMKPCACCCEIRICTDCGIAVSPSNPITDSYRFLSSASVTGGDRGKTYPMVPIEHTISSSFPPTVSPATANPCASTVRLTYHRQSMRIRSSSHRLTCYRHTIHNRRSSNHFTCKCHTGRNHRSSPFRSATIHTKGS